MVKTAEIDFTSFSGGVPIDNISSTTLGGTVEGTPTIVPTMPGFTYRPGVYFPIDDVVDRYIFDVNTVGGESLKIASSYVPTSQRSLVFWYYCYSSAHDGGATNYIWGGDASGFAIHSDGLYFVRDSTVIYTAASGTAVGWHNAVVTMDRVGNEYRCYFDGSPVYNDTTMAALTYSGLNPAIGHPTTVRESDTGVGYVASYDHILSPTDVAVLYTNFLLDSANPYPFVQMVGVVRDVNETVISGANVLVYDHSVHQVVEETLSESNGVYTVNFPNPGEFSIYTTKSGTPGGRASALTVTSGQQIIIYDEV